MLNIIAILFILFIAIIIEKKFKVPSPLVIVASTLGLIWFNPTFLSFTTMEVFSEEMLSFVVLLVLVDAFILRFEDLKKNWLSLVYLAGVAVILSIGSGVLLSNTVLSEYNLSLGSIIVLFAMVLATDPVTVVGTMKQYPKLPHKVKFLAEGESLFNDAIALMAFMAFGIYMMQGNEITVTYVGLITIKMLGLSIAIGGVIGFIGLLIMKRLHDTMSSLVLILLIAYSSFELAEYFHVSGLLAEIVAIVLLTTIIQRSYLISKITSENLKKRLTNEKTNIGKKKANAIMKKLFLNITDSKTQEEVLSFLTVIALFVNAVLFVSLARIMDFDNMFMFWKEILIIFITTTIIRMVMLGKFVFYSKKLSIISNIDMKSYFVLVFAGIKGGLSIVMLTMLKVFVPDFEHYDLFVAIVSGVILLSMVFYVIGLTITIKLNEKAFEKEYEEEKHSHHL